MILRQGGYIGTGVRRVVNQGDGAPTPSFSVNFLKGSLAALGGVTATFTRSTAALEFGSNGLLQSFAINVPRFGYNQSTLAAKGLLIEPEATQLVTPLASVRDMTDASWALGATMTRAFTSVGADGVSNKATRLTGGATAGTNTILQTLTAAASTRTYSCLMKRVTGTGTILIQQGATTKDVTAEINSTTFTLVQLSASVLDSAFGIQINTNGDAIDVDYNQFEAGDVTNTANSRIPDSISVRGADMLIYGTGAWYNPTGGTLYAEWLNPNLTGTRFVAGLNDASGDNRVLIYSDSIVNNAQQTLVGGVAQSALVAASLVGGAIAKSVMMFVANDVEGYSNNISTGSDTSGSIPTVTRLEVGSVVGTGHLGHYIRKVSYYPFRMHNATAKALTV